MTERLFSFERETLEQLRRFPQYTRTDADGRRWILVDGPALCAPSVTREAHARALASLERRDLYRPRRPGEAFDMVALDPPPI